MTEHMPANMPGDASDESDPHVAAYLSFEPEMRSLATMMYALAPLSRIARLRVFAAAASMLGHYDLGEALLNDAEREEKRATPDAGARAVVVP